MSDMETNKVVMSANEVLQVVSELELSIRSIHTEDGLIDDPSYVGITDYKTMFADIDAAQVAEIKQEQNTVMQTFIKGLRPGTKAREG
jgi:hypothetical protein